MGRLIQLPEISTLEGLIPVPDMMVMCYLHNGTVVDVIVAEEKIWYIE